MQQNITTQHTVLAKRLGISTYKEFVVYLPKDSYICAAEGFESPSRLKVLFAGKSIIATLNIVTSNFLAPNEVGLSDAAWEKLGVHDGASVRVSHPPAAKSMEHIRDKIYGKKLSAHAINEIVGDIVSGDLSNIQIAAFLSACAGNRLSNSEASDLTQAMLKVGKKIAWPSNLVVDKHCIGGLPGNRTTLIIVPIVAAFGLTIPKTSSRAITSSAGTVDTMETLAPVELSMEKIKQVVAQENGCIAWSDTAALSPADDIMIGVERTLNLDSQGQIVASILSKKIAAGSTHVLIDIPVGPTSKVRDLAEAEPLKATLEFVAHKAGMQIKTMFTDGSHPIGRGIGPALEAFDVLAVLQNDPQAPKDLRKRALDLAAQILEFSPQVKEGTGFAIAEEILVSGKAWQKFQAICEAQGGMRVPPRAQFTQDYLAAKTGVIRAIDNQKIASLAKLAGAPAAQAAGVYLHANVGASIDQGQPLLTIHASSQGELEYALDFLHAGNHFITID